MALPRFPSRTKPRVTRADNSKFTDSYNADLAADELSDRFRFVTDWDCWIAWTGTHWQREGARDGLIGAVTVLMRLAYLDERDKLADQEQPKKGARSSPLVKHYEASQNLARLQACVRLMQTRMLVRLADLDRNPWLFNTLTGTIDLRTGDVRRHDPNDLLTQVSAAHYDRAADCPTWRIFLSTVTGGDETLERYLRRLVGYSLAAVTSEHLLVFLYGGGRNGKSTFLQTVRSLFGDYGCAAPRDLLFEDRRGQRHPAELARLYGKRFAVCSEIGENVTLDEAKVKDLTGGDAVAVRRMNENFWDLVPTHTLFVAGNHKPKVRSDDEGIWRRVRLIPWTVTISLQNVDRDLPTKLKAEMPGILAWAVRGCLEWQSEGLSEPASVSEATAGYRRESDTIGEFFEDCLTFEVGAKVARSEVRKQYERWCEEEGHMTVGAKTLANRLRDRKCGEGHVIDMGRKKKAWTNVRIKTLLDVAVESPN